MLTNRFGASDDSVETVRRRMFKVSLHAAKFVPQEKHRNGLLDVHMSALSINQDDPAIVLFN